MKQKQCGDLNKKCLIIVNVFRKLGNVYEKEIITEKKDIRKFKI